jgi:NADH dehydrogenase
MTDTGSLVTVFGGSGFLGREVMRALAERGYRVRIAVRHPRRIRYRRPGGAEVDAVRANVCSPSSVSAAVRGAEAVINLVGILAEAGGQQPEAVHAEGAGIVAAAAAQVGARLIHISAIGVDEKSRARYARSKAHGEAAVRVAMPAATIFRPSIMFGPRDDFLNRFAAMTRILPFFPLIGGGNTRFQPVFVGDVANAIAKAVGQQTRPGITYELGGPDVMTFRKLMDFVLSTLDRDRLLVPIPVEIAKLQASVLQHLPGAPLTPDQVELLTRDSIVSSEAVREGRTLAAFDIDPTPIEAVVPSYLHRR